MNAKSPRVSRGLSSLSVDQSRRSSPVGCRAPWHSRMIIKPRIAPRHTHESLVERRRDTTGSQDRQEQHSRSELQADACGCPCRLKHRVNDPGQEDEAQPSRQQYAKGNSDQRSHAFMSVTPPSSARGPDHRAAVLSASPVFPGCRPGRTAARWRASTTTC